MDWCGFTLAGSGCQVILFVKRRYDQVDFFSFLMPYRSTSTILFAISPNPTCIPLVNSIYDINMISSHFCALIIIISLFSCVLFSFTQRLQRTREFSHEECLVETPGRTCDGEEAGASTSRTPGRTPGRAATPRRTPRSAVTPGRTPGSRGRRTPEAGVRGVKTGGGRRQLVRMAALRSPFASPNTQNQRLWVFYYTELHNHSCVYCDAADTSVALLWSWCLLLSFLWFSLL